LKTFFQIGTTPPIPPTDNEAIKALQEQVIILTNKTNDHENRIVVLENKLPILESSNLNLVTLFSKALAKLKEFLEEI